MARLTILTADEIDALYTLPVLDDEERAFLFVLDDDDKAYLDTLNNDMSCQINYILQLGYFKAKQYFFTFSLQKVKFDADFIRCLYYPETVFPKKQLLRKSHYRNRTQIIAKYQLQETSGDSDLGLLKEAKALAKRHALPRFVLEGLLTFCQQENIIRPAYSRLQDLVSEALRVERKRLVARLYRDASKDVRKRLDALLDNDDLFYSLTLIKKDQKNFSITEIKKTIAKQQLISALYDASCPLMLKLGISEQNILYYANLAEFYTIQKLKQLKDKNLVRLYLLCYVHRRLLKINDHLISSFIHKVSKYNVDAEQYQRSKVDMAESMDKQLRIQAYQVMAINVDLDIPDDLVRQKAFEVIPKEGYDQFLKDFKKPNLERDFYRWQYYKQVALSIKKNIRPIFKALSFSCAEDEMEQAIQFLQTHLGSGKPFRDYSYKEVPLQFISKPLRRLITDKVAGADNSQRKIKKVNGDAYEFMVYQQIKKGLAQGTVFVKASYAYRALEDELIDIAYWSTHKQAILKQLNMPLLSADISTLLEQLKANLQAQYTQVNQRINSGENTALKLKYNPKGELVNWTLPYTRLEEGINNPFYDKLPLLSIGDLLKFSAEKTGFIDCFSHIQPRYAKSSPDAETLYACIIASATGVEIKKMKAISDIKDYDLDRANNSFIRYQTLCDANNKIMNHTAKLPIFTAYNLADYGVHASVDGQKFATKYNTIKSRYSKKYFGMMRGVVLYSLNANHLPLCLKVIGANQHESHYLLDIVESNASEVEIKAISGDMHSINRVNFALMYLFGYRFMPRFTQLSNKADHKLVYFDGMPISDDDIIKPSKKANETLIIKEWDNVLRILASLALKKTTQSQIVRKLSSYTKTNPTLNALIAFDEIIMTDYLLTYIDIPEMRSIVQGALNRGESYHQLSSTIAKVSGGRMLNGKNEIELDINAEAIRLCANAVIFYNASLLSMLYEHYLDFDPQKAKEILRFSPVAWQHISFIGKYEFYDNKELIDIQEVMDNLLAELESDNSSEEP